jgi:hypothetical protein
MADADDSQQQLRSAIVNQLSQVAEAGECRVEGTEIVLSGDRLRLAPEVREVGNGRAHVHVAARLGTPVQSLDACVVGMGEDAGAAVTAAARVWLALVGAPILSLLEAVPVLAADHFDGTEAWGVPGCHGFVGPFLVRGDAEGLDMQALAQARAFSSEAPDFAPNTLHLLKATLVGNGERWRRTLEIDGHSQSDTVENWPLGIAPPAAPVIAVRFAVAFRE